MVYIDLLIEIVLILIMFGIGVSLTVDEVKIVFSRPKALFVSLFSQMVFLPMMAFLIASSFEIPSYIQIGLVILAASPGGTTSGFLSYLFGGNVALSIVLTSVNSILTLFSIPFIVNLALMRFLGEETSLYLPIVSTVKEIFMLTVIPAFLGILLRHKQEKIAVLILKYTKRISIVLLAIVFTLKFIGKNGNGGITPKEIIAILPYALLLNVGCFLVGYFVSRLFNLGIRNYITISIESAVHNTTIAFLVAEILLGKPVFSKVPLVYAMFSFWTAVLFTILLIKLHKGNLKSFIKL